MTRGWPDEEGRRRRWRDTLLETRRFAGTLSIGVLATPAVNILPLTNPPGGPWVVLLTEKGRQIVRSERIEREGGRRGRTRDGARGTLERERAEGRRGSRDWSRLRERRMERYKREDGGCLCTRGRRRCRRRRSRRRRRRHSLRHRPACCVRDEVDGHYYPTKHPILSYPPDTILS